MHWEYLSKNGYIIIPKGKLSSIVLWVCSLTITCSNPVTIHKGPLKVYPTVNFRVPGINRGACKLGGTPTVIQNKKGMVL